MTERTRIIVVGGGPAGLMAAIAIASANVPVTLVAQSGPADNRTTALLASSVAALDTLGVWERCHGQAAALSVMRIVDDTGRLIRGPETRFESTEIGLDAFGYNIENRHLVAALQARAEGLPSLERVDGSVTTVAPATDSVAVTLADGRVLHAQLVVAADGRRSLCRSAAGIEMREHRYPQSALTLSFAHSRPHNNTSTEFHTASGPFTLVPLPGQRSSLVWVVHPRSIDTIRSLDETALASEIERRAHSILGKITLEGSRGLFPLSSSVAERFADKRIALVVEAGHVIPPIGAQGLNLGLRDAAALAEIACDTLRLDDDPGAPEALARYDAARRQDVGRRALAVDLLNRSLLTDFLPVQSARGFGLYLLDRIGPLRRAVMREGVAPTGDLPQLMRGEPLAPL
jgi:2-octaprenyl-6-methoxyphenol hydroxylase